MDQHLVCDITDYATQKLRRRATQNGRSVEEEARRILEAAVGDSDTAAYGSASRFAAQFTGIGLTDEEAAMLASDLQNAR